MMGLCPHWCDQSLCFLYVCVCIPVVISESGKFLCVDENQDYFKPQW